MRESGGLSLVVVFEGSLGEPSGYDRVGVRVMVHRGEYRGPRLFVEAAEIATDRSK
jgi:hypothetical protein